MPSALAPANRRSVCKCSVLHSTRQTGVAGCHRLKFNRRQEFVVGGFKPNADGFESLLVGYYEGRKLMFASKVRAGLTPHIRAELFPAAESPSSNHIVPSRTSQAARPAIGAKASRPKT